MTWLIMFLISHSSNPYVLNKWACDKVNSQSDAAGGGCYDWCNAHALYQKTTGDTFDEKGAVTYHNDNKNYQTAFVGLDEDYSHDLQNACAIVVTGGEY